MRVRIDRSGSKRLRLNFKFDLLGRFIFKPIDVKRQALCPSYLDSWGLARAQTRHAQVNKLACTAAVADQSDPSVPTKMSHRAQVLTEINRFRLVLMVFGAKTRF